MSESEKQNTQVKENRKIGSIVLSEKEIKNFLDIESNVEKKSTSPSDLPRPPKSPKAEDAVFVESREDAENEESEEIYMILTQFLEQEQKEISLPLLRRVREILDENTVDTKKTNDYLEFFLISVEKISGLQKLKDILIQRFMMKIIKNSAKKTKRINLSESQGNILLEILFCFKCSLRNNIGLDKINEDIDLLQFLLILLLNLKRNVQIKIEILSLFTILCICKEESFKFKLIFESSNQILTEKNVDKDGNSTLFKRLVKDLDKFYKNEKFTQNCFCFLNCLLTNRTKLSNSFFFQFLSFFEVVKKIEVHYKGNVNCEKQVNIFRKEMGYFEKNKIFAVESKKKEKRRFSKGISSLKINFKQKKDQLSPLEIQLNEKLIKIQKNVFILNEENESLKRFKKGNVEFFQNLEEYGIEAIFEFFRMLKEESKKADKYDDDTIEHIKILAEFLRTNFNIIIQTEEIEDELKNELEQDKLDLLVPPPLIHKQLENLEFQQLELTKLFQVKKKKKKVKRNLHLERISDRKVKKTIFFQKDIVQKAHLSFDSKLVKQLKTFIKKSSKIKKKSKNIVPKINIMPKKRAQNIEIQLKTLGFGMNKLCDYLLQINEIFLNRETVEKLYKMLPTEQEIDKISKYSGEFDDLSVSSQFFFLVSKISLYSEKVKCLNYKNQYEDSVKFLKPKLQAWLKTSNTLINNTNFHEFLKYILIIGNIMKRKKKMLYGFRMKSLHQLVFVKSGTSSLLRMLVSFLYENKKSSILNFGDELNLIDEVIDFDSVRVEYSSLKKSLSEINLTISKVKKLKIKNDQFCTKMKYFLKSKEDVTNMIDKMFKKVDKLVDELAVLFNEDKNHIKRGFFEDFSSFVMEFNKCHYNYKNYVKRMRTKKVRQEKVKTMNRDSKRLNINQLQDLISSGEIFEKKKKNNFLSKRLFKRSVK